MREELRVYCDLFQKNREVIKKTFSFESEYLYIVCANMLAGKGILAKGDSLKEAKAIVNKNTGIISNFRGNVKLPMICSLEAAKGSALERFQMIQNNYEKIKKEFFATEYTALIAAALVDVLPNQDITPYVKRGKEIYQKMKMEHPFITSSEDSVMAILLAFSEKDNDTLISEIELSYDYLKKSIRAGSNATQTLSHILSLVEGNALEKCEKVVDIMELLGQNGRRYGKEYELSMLGVAAVMSVPKEIFVSEVLEVDEFLSGQQGYGFLGIPKKTRLMHAAMLVIGSYNDEKNTQNATVSSITGTMAMLAAQQAAMCAIIAASAASTASNS